MCQKKGQMWRVGRGIIQKWVSRIELKFYVWIAIIFCPLLAFADTNDLLTPAAAEVKGTFGQGSTMWYIIFTLEVLAAGYSFIIKKSLPAFLGVVALIIFTTVAFKMIPGAPS